MSRRDMLDVVVVGAGVVGASAALAFARDGLQVALVEAREPSPWRADEPDLRVYAFAPDNAALLDSLTLLWSEILGHEVIDHDANFFDLGGDSLLATQLVSRLRTRLGLDLPISAVFETPTVRGLAERLMQLSPTPDSASPCPPATWWWACSAAGPTVTPASAPTRRWARRWTCWCNTAAPPS